MKITLNMISFVICIGLGVFSWFIFGLTNFLIIYALCALVNVPSIIKQLK